MAGDDDADGELSDDDLARLLDPDFAPGSVIREPTAGERAEQMVRAARRADLQRRLEEEEARKAQEEKDLRRQERRERGGRADRRGIRLAIGLFVVVALLAAVAFSLLRRNESTPSTTSAATRVTTTKARPAGYPPLTKEASKPLGSPPPLPAASGPFEFLYTQPGSTEPVAWDPCRPVRYVINPEGAPPGGVQLIQEAVAKTAAATGLQFQYVGETTEKWSKTRKPYQPERYGSQEWAPALIAWSTQKEVPGLAGYIAGLSGGEPQADLKDQNRDLYVSGSSVLDADDLGVLIAAGHPELARIVIQHEMGHLVGLDHVADPNQVMYSESTPKVLDWGAGDLRGLHALGTGACMPDV